MPFLNNSSTIQVDRDHPACGNPLPKFKLAETTQYVAPPFQNSSWQRPPNMWQPPSKIQVDRDHPVCGNPTWNKFWFSKSEFLELCLSNNTNTRIVNITWCFVSFEQVLCDDDHVSATRSQPPKWQSMSRSDTQWHPPKMPQIGHVRSVLESERSYLLNKVTLLFWKNPSFF